jgi:hypothetical protein
MSQRSIEEVFRRIAPSRRRGIPSPPTIAAGVDGSNGDLSTSLSTAASEIAQLRASYQQQADLIKANTQAVQNNTSGAGGRSAVGTVGSAVSRIFGGVLGTLSPILSGILHLFGGGGTQPVTLPVYTPPPPISIGGVLHSSATTEAPQAGVSSPVGQSQTAFSPANIAPQISYSSAAIEVPQAGVSSPVGQSLTASGTAGYEETRQTAASSAVGNSQPTPNAVTYSPQITVNVNAMDSQSFMDRSDDIASAVRAAMLNMHPINDVVADL